MRRLLSALLLSMLLPAPLYAQAPHFAPTDGPAVPADAATARALDEIWAIEARIYAGRARGTMQPYVDAVSRNMLSFPFGVANPLDYAAFAASAQRFSGDRERNRVFLKGFYLTGGNTAVIFYRSHRTVRPDGAPVDEYWDTTHIYAREADGWKLMSSINRAADSKDLSSPRPPIEPHR
ncbi:MAG: nuclear transport factor 2 family protein [Gammaproteobacteria bacterium]|nr:nuclear transport factor 2 family protein [Gammaproteobacteria bacterium]